MREGENLKRESFTQREEKSGGNNDEVQGGTNSDRKRECKRKIEIEREGREKRRKKDR